MNDIEDALQHDDCSALRWHLVWVLVFAANLPLPVLLGHEFGPEARTRMIAGVIVWLILSHYLLHRVETLRDAMVCGGICVALWQVLFVLHIFAGAVAAYFASGLCDIQSGSFATGFWLTVFTGGELILVALICGCPVWMFIRFCQETL